MCFFNQDRGIVIMNTKEIKTEYRMAQWTGLLQERAATGETIKAFCENRGISKNTYFYWQKKLREAAVRQVATKTSNTQSQALVPNGWTRLSEEEPAKTSALPVEIGGCRVMVDNDTDPELLTKVCKVLVSLC